MFKIAKQVWVINYDHELTYKDNIGHWKFALVIGHF